jgi:hypothetical protein
MKEEIRMTLRLPPSAVAFLDDIAKGNFTSRNAEIVRSIRERMERSVTTAGVGFADTTPAVVSDTTALQGGASHPRL